MQNRPIGIHILDRRDVVLGTLASALFAKALSALPAAAATEAGQRSLAFWNTFRLLVGEAAPEEALVTLKLDEIAENGNNVPFEISVESPMSETDYIKTIHLLSTSNPQPAVAAFHLTPASGKAHVKGRMRLARTQDVIALAEKSDGKLLIATRRIEVTIGGCGN